MKWNLDELKQFMKMDPQLNILFVEGDHDLSFWRSLVPISERGNTQVYKVGLVDIDGGPGGEKAKLFALSEALLDPTINERVRFFADADHDRILGRAIPDNIILTDARDREAYLITQEGFAALCETGFNRDAQFTAETVRLATALLRPLGIARVMSERNALQLPFQQTLNPDSDPGRARRYWVTGKTGADVDLTRLLRALLQNADKSLAGQVELAEALAAEEAALRNFDDDQIIHGKDFVSFVAWRFQCAYEAAQACINLALCQLKAILLQRPNIGFAVDWVRQGAVQA